MIRSATPRNVESLNINGRWMSKPITGTGRYAEGVCKALIAGGYSLVLWVPRDAIVPAWAECAEIRRSRFRGIVFEQIILPLQVKGRMILCMGGPAIVLKRHQVAVLHDATPFRMPETYSRLFAAWYRIMYRMVVRRGARIATVSEFSATELSTVLTLGRDRLILAPPAATLASTERAPVADVPPGQYLLTVGTLAPHKNLVPVISALAAAGHLVVCAGTAGTKQVFAEAGLPQSESLVALGRVSDEELLWLYRNARALIFPSLYEGFGLPAVEAQQAGCVVIASSNGPLPEVLRQSALFASADDPSSFVRQARRLAESPHLAADLRRRGMLNARRFRWADTAAALSAAVQDTHRSARKRA